MKQWEIKYISRFYIRLLEVPLYNFIYTCFYHKYILIAIFITSWIFVLTTSKENRDSVPRNGSTSDNLT